MKRLQVPERSSNYQDSPPRCASWLQLGLTMQLKCALKEWKSCELKQNERRGSKIKCDCEENVLELSSKKKQKASALLDGDFKAELSE